VIVPLAAAGASSGAASVAPARLVSVAALASIAAGAGGGSGNLAWRVALAGLAAGVALVADAHGDTLRPLQGLSGAEGWESPQLEGVTAGGCVAGGEELSISGIPNVTLSG
jgi:hypothetical protein